MTPAVKIFLGAAGLGTLFYVLRAREQKAVIGQTVLVPVHTLQTALGAAVPFGALDPNLTVAVQVLGIEPGGELEGIVKGAVAPVGAGLSTQTIVPLPIGEIVVTFARNAILRTL